MPTYSPFLDRVYDGGTRLVRPEDAGQYTTPMQQYQAAIDRRMALTPVIADFTNAANQRKFDQRQNASEMAQRQREFGAELEIAQRGQILKEVEAKAKAILGGRGSEIDLLAAQGRNRYYDQQSALAERQQAWKEGQPNDLELLMAKHKLDQEGGLQGLSAHNQQMHQMATTKLFETQIADVRKNMSEAELTPDGQREWAAMSGELRAIEAQRDSLRLPAYNQAIGGWLDKYQKADFGSKTKVPPTPTEIIGSQYDPETGIFLQKNSKGGWEGRPIQSATDLRRELELKEKELDWKIRSEGGSASGGTDIPLDAFSIEELPPKNVETIRQRAIESINDRREQQALADGKQPSKKISPDELFTEMKNLFDDERKLQANIYGGEEELRRRQYQAWSEKQDSPSRVPEYFMGGQGGSPLPPAPGARPAPPEAGGMPEVPNQPRQTNRISPLQQWSEQQDVPRRVPEELMSGNADVGAEETPEQTERLHAVPEEVTNEYKKRAESGSENDTNGIGYLRRVLRTNQIGGDGSQFLTSRALQLGQELGQDPIEYAAKNAADAIREKRQRYHWGTMPTMEKQYHELLGTPTIPYEGEELEQALKQLPPGAMYFDKNLNLRQKEKPKGLSKEEKRQTYENLPDKFQYPGMH